MSSQYNEDQIIRDFFGSFVGTFLDLGAGDGELCSNTAALSKLGWVGVCVEPEVESFRALQKFYRGRSNVFLINAAVSSDGRLLEFFKAGQLSTGVHLLAPYDEFYLLPSITPDQIDQIRRKDALRFEFVSLDCEGMDQEIAAASAGLFEHTQLLCYEHDLPCRPSDEAYTRRWQEILEVLGFTRVVERTTGNTLVARK